MTFVIFVAPNNFKDETLKALKLFLDRWGVEYKITSYSNKECVGYHGSTLMPDINTAKVYARDFDGIIIVDGKGLEDYKLYEYRPFLDVLLDFNNSKKKIAAISNGIRILARANIIKDKKISTPTDEETKRAVQLFHGVVTDNPIEISDNIITIKSSTNIEGPLQELLQHLGAM